MTAPQHTFFNNSGARNNNIRGCMSSYLSGPLSIAMIYNLVLKTEARFTQDISSFSARLDASMREIRSLVTGALYPTGQHGSNSPAGLRGNEELIQQRRTQTVAGSNVTLGAPPRASGSNAASSAQEISSTSNRTRKQARCPLCPGFFTTCAHVRTHLVKYHKLRRLPTRLRKCSRCYKVFLKTEDKDGHKNERNKICKSRRDRLN